MINNASHDFAPSLFGIRLGEPCHTSHISVELILVTHCPHLQRAASRGQPPHRRRGLWLQPPVWLPPLSAAGAPRLPLCAAATAQRVVNVDERDGAVRGHEPGVLLAQRGVRMSQSPACARCAHVPKFRTCRHQARSRKGRHLPCPMSGVDHKAYWHGSSKECWVKTCTIDSADTGSCWACSTPTGRRGARRSCVSIRPAAVPADTVIEPDQVPQNDAHRSKAHLHHVQQGGHPCELHDKPSALYSPVNTRRESRRPSTLQVFPSMASTPMRWAVSRLREQ